jgi:hypothetical protein
MKDVLLDQLERTRTLQQLVAQAVGQFGSFQLSLFVAQGWVDSCHSNYSALLSLSLTLG